MESIKEDINVCYKHGAPNGAKLSNIDLNLSLFLRLVLYSS
jgi:hypothetical protein